MEERIHATGGMLYYIVNTIRPELAKRVAENNRLETIIIGLGGQGSKHAGLMHKFGTTIAAGVAPGKAGTRVHEVIPVFDSVADCLKEHPDIVAASIWRHYATAREAAIEAIEAGIPLVVLITEGIPLRDVRDIIVAARKNNTVLIGGNTPGLIFPPERIKIGMLPDVFYPEETAPGKFGSHGVTIISRSGAILYHMSDAMAGVGIAQNAVIGVGGDGAIGSTFRDLVPLAMGYENTDLVIVAGEIGGCQEEMLAGDIRENPDKYPKPLVALISGAHAPEGKTMGHAGAIVTPGLETGTFKSKKDALESAGVTVVNSQYDLITAVQKALKKKTYFAPERYYQRMRRLWEAPPARPGWGTQVTKVVPDNLVIRGYALAELIAHASMEEAVSLIIEGELPPAASLPALKRIVAEALNDPMPPVKTITEEELSKTLARLLLGDEQLAMVTPKSALPRTELALYAMGRCIGYLAGIFRNEKALAHVGIQNTMAECAAMAVTGRPSPDKAEIRMIEAMIVASMDHGVTPPSAQATRIASSVRASYEMAVAQGIGAITDVHGGAGEKAAVFFSKCASLARESAMDLPEAVKSTMESYVKKGRRIEGMGHRIHTQDPRRDVLWQLAEKLKIAGPCVEISRMATGILESVRGMNLPINVDGVIGSIIADMKLNPKFAKALFILGRMAGLSAHYFEEVSTQPPMRRINFSQAEYRGPADRPFPKK